MMTCIKGTLIHAAEDREHVAPACHASPPESRAPDFFRPDGMSLVEMRKMQADHYGPLRKKKRDGMGNPLPFPRLVSEVKRLLKKGLGVEGVSASDLNLIASGKPVLKKVLLRVKRAVYPTSSQRLALERLVSVGPEYVGGTSVQILQNLSRKGWAEMLDAEGHRVEVSSQALTAQITREGKRIAKKFGGGPMVTGGEA